MSKFTAFIIIVALRIVFHPSDAQSGIAPFTSPSTLPASAHSLAPAKLISISDHKVILNWVVGQNETADKFEIEKSADGKIFTLAALVSGTDRPERDNYQFYERSGNKKVMYRIKMVNKNRQSEYSAVIEINPHV